MACDRRGEAADEDRLQLGRTNRKRRIEPDPKESLRARPARGLERIAWTTRQDTVATIEPSQQG